MDFYKKGNAMLAADQTETHHWKNIIFGVGVTLLF